MLMCELGLQPSWHSGEVLLLFFRVLCQSRINGKLGSLLKNKVIILEQLYICRKFVKAIQRIPIYLILSFPYYEHLTLV